MVELFGKNYYINIDGITDRCRTTPTVGKTENDTDVDEEDDESIHINIFKYELIKMCLERILGEIDEVDESLGKFGQEGASVSFKIAFNTLIKNQILIEDDE
jgi:hypothetical protein